MHELSIALSILDAAAEEAQRHGGGRLLAIHLRVGPLAGVDRDALISAFDVAREGTGLAETTLTIEDAPLLVQCPTCQAQRPAVSIQQLRCRECGTPAAQVISGRELDIVALELA